jgi:hypothetical protein
MTANEYARERGSFPCFLHGALIFIFLEKTKNTQRTSNRFDD